MTALPCIVCAILLMTMAVSTCFSRLLCTTPNRLQSSKLKLVCERQSLPYLVSPAYIAARLRGFRPVAAVKCATVRSRTYCGRS